MPTRRRRTIDATTMLIAGEVAALLVVAGSGRAPDSDAAPPRAGGFAHGAPGSGRNGAGGSIATSSAMRSWPGNDGNGGPFAFIGAHYGSMWRVPTSANNSMGVGYRVMEDVAGEGAVSAQPDPAVWDAGEMARAAAVMATFGGDRVVPYGIDASGPYDVASGEGSSRRCSTAVNTAGGDTWRSNLAVKMFVEDVRPTGAVAGMKLAGDTSFVDGSGADFSALRNGYTVAQRPAAITDVQHTVGGLHLDLAWGTADGAQPTTTGTHPLEVRVTDGAGKSVGFVPAVALSDVGIGSARAVGAVVRADRHIASDDNARHAVAVSLGWPTMHMAGELAADRRFAVGSNPEAAAIADANGIARFDVTTAGPAWELALHTQAPTADVTLHSGTGIQGQITRSGPPQSATAHTHAVPQPTTTTCRVTATCRDSAGSSRCTPTRTPNRGPSTSRMSHRPQPPPSRRAQQPHQRPPPSRLRLRRPPRGFVNVRGRGQRVEHDHHHGGAAVRDRRNPGAVDGSPVARSPSGRTRRLSAS